MTERSYELANRVLESSYDIFSNLAEEDREPFLLFAKSVTRASWADTRLYFERGPKLIESISIGVGVFHPTTWKPKQYFLPTYSIDIKFK